LIQLKRAEKELKMVDMIIRVIKRVIRVIYEASKGKKGLLSNPDSPVNS